jgi:hypothetical protein
MSRASYMPHSATRSSRPWAGLARSKQIIFLCLNFIEYSLMNFVQIFEQFSYSLSIQINPPKICLENSKLREILL